MKRNKLYTVNRWNKPALMFDLGGVQTTGLGSIYQSQIPSVGNGLTGSALSGLQKTNQQQLQLGTYNLGIDNSSGAKGSSFNKGATMQAIGSTALNAASAIDTGDRNGLFDTLDPVYHLAGGRESKVGNALSDTGVALTKSGNPWMMLAGAGLKIVGGLTNAAFGIKENKDNVNLVNQNINTASTTGRLFGLANTNADLLASAGGMATGSGLNWNDLYENGWFTSEGTEKGKDLLNLERRSISSQNHALRTTADLIEGNNYRTMMRISRPYDFGGPLIDISTPTGYAAMTDKYALRQLNNSDMRSLFAGTPNVFAIGGGVPITDVDTRSDTTRRGYREGIIPYGAGRDAAGYSGGFEVFAQGGPLFNPNIRDFGGGINTNGANFDTGISYINAGGTHEENPNEGVQMGVDNEGTPNLVEEGEVRWNDYIFSDRLTVPNYKKEYKKKSKDIPYEAQVLWDYDDRTFADAAKKIIKRNGEGNDPITARGNEAQLSVLALVQEKEREKEKLQEMQDAIDEMSPEEFAMLLQQMASQLAALQQAAMLQQLQLLMIPLGMELMQPVAQMQPVAALGGLLNMPNKKLFYNGGWTDYLKELANYGITPEQYLQYLNSKRAEDNLLTLEGINDATFGKNDVADEVLKRVETISKKYSRLAKRRGIDTSKLKGSSLAQYNRELNQAIQKGLMDSDYNVAEDVDISLNSNKVTGAKDKDRLLTYNGVTNYRNLIATGGRDVKLDEKGHPTWEGINGLKKIDNSEEGFYNSLGIYNNDELNKRGIYDYGTRKTSSIDNYDDLKLYGWKRGEDGSYAVSKDRVNPDNDSKVKGASDKTYKISSIGKKGDDDYLPYGAEGYKEALEAILGNDAYKALTNEVLEAIDDAFVNNDGRLDSMSPEMQNYLKYLDANSAIENKNERLLINKGTEENPEWYLNPGTSSDTARNASLLYNDRRNDNNYGIYHYQYERGESPSASRYYYMDNGTPVYIEKPEEGSGFTISSTPKTVNVDGTLFNDYEVTGLNRNRVLTLLPTGEVVDVTDINRDGWKKLDKPVLEDNKDNLGYGVNGTSDWVLYNDDGTYKGAAGGREYENDTFPKPSNWPLLAAAGLLGAGLLYNIASPIDYSNADALINASKDAGNFRPVQFKPIGNYLTYNPLDIWYGQNRLNAIARAADRTILNSSLPEATKYAMLLAANQSDLLAQGNLFRLGLEYDDALKKTTGEFNKDTDKFNSEGFLKADMANLDAATRAAGFKLEGTKAGYAMRLAAEDAKANAISAGLSGLANLGLAFGQNKWNQDVLRWRLKHNQYPISQLEGDKYLLDPNWEYKDGYLVKRSKGGKVRRKHKGLEF